MTTDKTPTDALAKLRHLYANLTNGGVRDTASAKRIAEGLLAPAIEALERGAPQPTQAQAGAVQLDYARLQAISLDYSDSEDECTGFRDGWRSAEKHHGIKEGGQHGTE